MHGRVHTSKRLIGETPPEFRADGRDLRIDICRGLALWWIFLDHVPNNIGSWLTPRNYGFCDAAEIFMFISGVTCALAYGRAQQREGWSGTIGRSLRRGWDIYAAFLLLTLACAVLVYLAGSDDLADESNTRVLLENPGPTLAHAAILQYRPVNTDVLPVFVMFHVLFAPLLWLLLRAPNVTLGVSFLLYALVHAFGWSVPAWPNGVWFFNPLAWQLLFVLGAWCVIAGETIRPWVMSRTVLALAALYLASSLVLALSWGIKPPVQQSLTALLLPQDKSNLSPLRVLHFLALAIVVLRLIPRNWRGLSAPALRYARFCGENSLPIYCLGVLLALAGHLALLDISEGLTMQIVLSIAGILMMIFVARLLNTINNKLATAPAGAPDREGRAGFLKMSGGWNSFAQERRAAVSAATSPSERKAGVTHS